MPSTKRTKQNAINKSACITLGMLRLKDIFAARTKAEVDYLSSRFTYLAASGCLYLRGCLWASATVDSIETFTRCLGFGFYNQSGCPPRSPCALPRHSRQYSTQLCMRSSWLKLLPQTKPRFRFEELLQAAAFWQHTFR
jgi:hypothetical protein